MPSPAFRPTRLRHWLWLLLACAVVATAQPGLQQQLETATAATPPKLAGRTLHSPEPLLAFYRERGFQRVWTEADAGQLIAAIENARSHGLTPDDYHLYALRTQPEGDTRELLLSDAFLTLGNHLLAGKVAPDPTDKEWTVERRRRDLGPVLAQALANDSIAAELEALAPSQRGYARLREARARVAQLSLEAGSWPPIPAGETLRPNGRDPRVEAIRARLRQLGDYTATDAAADASLYDPVLYAAAMRFQLRHGLAADGVIGPATLTALNVPLAQRLQQIDLNLERWRWQPGKLGRKFVLVNIAGFELWVIEDGQLVMKKQVVVGKEYRRTPIFSDRIRYLEFNPTWTVPPKLAVQDKLPEIRRDPSYLARQGFSVYRGWGESRKQVDPATVDWGTLSKRNFPYTLVQAPGPQNALGRVKFMFPNSFDVYLHDTPSQALFQRATRAFSSGCVRVHEAMDLAELLLRTEPGGWTRERIDAIVASGERKVVNLREPIPVHIQYATAWVDNDGGLQFRNDIYSRDDELATALFAAYD